MLDASLEKKEKGEIMGALDDEVVDVDDKGEMEEEEEEQEPPSLVAAGLSVRFVLTSLPVMDSIFLFRLAFWCTWRKRVNSAEFTKPVAIGFDRVSSRWLVPGAGSLCDSELMMESMVKLILGALLLTTALGGDLVLLKMGVFLNTIDRSLDLLWSTNWFVSSVDSLLLLLLLFMKAE